MSAAVYYVICAILTVGILVGIAMMSKVQTAIQGNMLSAICTGIAVILTLYQYDIITQYALWICMAIGLVVGLIGAYKVKMIEMPQVVALLNGFGGAASALVAIVSILDGYQLDTFSLSTAGLALAIGMITLTGSLVAAGKLHKLLPQKPVVWPGHQAITLISILLVILSIVVFPIKAISPVIGVLVCVIVSGFFGVAFSIRVGGADMPITISLLNSLSGVAGSIAGMAIGDILLVAVGGIVGASGLLLTQIMCRAINRSLPDILLGKTSAPAKKQAGADPNAVANAKLQQVAAIEKKEALSPEQEAAKLLAEAKKVFLIPGYGMALAQAQNLVKQLADKLEQNGVEVEFAIHPVAGRMPGHMNVLLAEVDVPYEKLHEMEEINPQFDSCDVAVIIGANDVVNPAANTAEGTPIYGMPVLAADKAKHVIICNYDLKPGYAGVENPLYTKEEGVTLLLGDAKKTLADVLSGIDAARAGETAKPAARKRTPEQEAAKLLAAAKKVFLIPGYGMALAQAQSLVKQLADKLEQNGVEVEFAIHPVAGRMPGHMNVLLAEVDVPYEKLHEMEEINPQFDSCDVAVIIGANDVVNPAANTAEGTPIYGMPVLAADKAKHVIICNYDLKPGYAGVENPLYTKTEGVTLLLGDAKKTLADVLSGIDAAGADEELGEKTAAEYTPVQKAGALLAEAKKVFIIPGYGMALAQAQSLVKQLADKLEQNGVEVEFAIHPVAGRMPGHMNVLLAEVDVPYEKLHEMEEINPQFDSCDVAVIIGANDVVNPAANTAEGTPIYGMPVLAADKAKHVIICNYDLKPGYAGVENPLYTNEEVTLLLGDAKETLTGVLSSIDAARTAPQKSEAASQGKDPVEAAGEYLSDANKVFIIPGYGMALAQAQSLVKQLADKLEQNGVEVEFAIHPVAGRMPGHMNVLLAEVDVPYEKLHEMEEINPQFDSCDVAVIIGANDVVNPAANTAEGTPIYGMPVLAADKAKHVIICNYDLKPGYAGVENPLYTKTEGVTLLLGDAKDMLTALLSKIKIKAFAGK